MQDFDEKVQKEIHRIQSFELTQNALNLVRNKGIKSVNMDLIYGLPYQNLQSFTQTLEKVMLLNPDRLAIFNYAHVPWLKKNMRKFDENTLPSPDVKLEILEFCEKFLSKNGYKMIGMDHFAKENDELFKALENGTLHRNFQGYTTKGGADLVGVGLTSIGEGQRHYAQNFKDMSSYEAALDRGVLPFERGVILSDDDELRKAVIMELMANFKLDIKSIEKEFSIDFKEYFKEDLKALEEYKDFVNFDENFIKVNETGVLLIRNIAMCFDAYMKNISEDKKYSQKRCKMKFSQISDACVKCGKCIPVCTIHEENRDEITSPRGFLDLLTAYKEGSLELDKEAKKVFESCFYAPIVLKYVRVN